MKYLLLGNSNAARAAELFLTKDHAQKKERPFVRCTSAMGFKLQVISQTTFLNTIFNSMTLWAGVPLYDSLAVPITSRVGVPT